MEHSLREKAKAFWAMRRSYEAIAKHNQVSECSGYVGQWGHLKAILGVGGLALVMAVDTVSLLQP